MAGLKLRDPVYILFITVKNMPYLGITLFFNAIPFSSEVTK